MANRWLVSGPGSRQRGTIIVIAAVTLSVAVLVTALVVDLARIYYQRQQLQGVADAAALAGVTVLAGNPDQAAVAAAAQSVAVLNGYAGDLVAEAGAVQLGHATSVAGVRDFAPGAPFNAVRVEAVQSVSGSLVAARLLPGDVGLRTRAVAHQEAIGGLQVGSFLLGVDSERSAVLNVLLGGLLGGSVSLNAVAYDGLAAAHLNLQDLIDAGAGVGTAQELLALDLGLGEWLQLMATALANRGDAAAVYLDQLALAADPALHLVLGDLIFVERGEAAALEAMLNAFDLMMAMAQVANGDSAVDLDFATSGLLAALGLADLGVRLQLIEPPRIAIGPPGRDPDTGEWYTWAENGQVSLEVQLETLSVNLGLISTRVNLDLFVDAARADAALASVMRATPSVPYDRAEVEAHTEIARIGIGRRSNGTVSPSVLVDVHVQVLGITVTRLYATAVADVTVGNPEAQSVQFNGPFVPAIAVPSPQNTQRIGTDADVALQNALSALLADTSISVGANLLGIGLSVNEVIQTLLGIIAPLLDDVALRVLAPLLAALGVDLGGADITLFYLSAGEPRLIR
jgi:uncharacterized membrane protein